MTDKQQYICMDCKHHYYDESYDGEEEIIFSICKLGNETSPFIEFECEDFENDN